MADNRTIPFAALSGCGLIVDALYEGGAAGHAGDDPIARLVGTGNQGGFRYVGSVTSGVRLCVLYSSLTELDWPDTLDPETGRFLYYGDNRTPGHDLHETRRKGNAVLREAFERLDRGDRQRVPPFLVFTKAAGGRDVVFRGLAVPGAIGLTISESLVAIWKTKNGQRFQNYRSIFTILNVAAIPREWIQDLRRGNPTTNNAPPSWLEWIKSGSYSPLIAPRTKRHRTIREQLPSHEDASSVVATIVSYFDAHPRGAYAFEECAAVIAQLMDPNIISFDLTRPWRDGGRDALGLYRIGQSSNAIEVEFALEAKCKGPGSGSGVRETSRLIARLRHRQFGIFVTTSYVAEQAYLEVIDDAHPLIIIAGADIAKILLDAGYGTAEATYRWLRERFPYVEVTEVST